jgi:hypothetical protein
MTLSRASLPNDRLRYPLSGCPKANSESRLQSARLFAILIADVYLDAQLSGRSRESRMIGGQGRDGQVDARPELARAMSLSIAARSKKPGHVFPSSAYPIGRRGYSSSRPRRPRSSDIANGATRGPHLPGSTRGPRQIGSMRSSAVPR